MKAKGTTLERIEEIARKAAARQVSDQDARPQETAAAPANHVLLTVEEADELGRHIDELQSLSDLANSSDALASDVGIFLFQTTRKLQELFGTLETRRNIARKGIARKAGAQ